MTLFQTNSHLNHPLRVVFAGTPDFAAASLAALLAMPPDQVQVVAVYTQPDRKAGRGQQLRISPVKQLALQHGLPIEQPESFSLKHKLGVVSRETLAAYQPDVMIVAAYGLILPKGVLALPKFGCINVHASLLPRWRGAAPIQRAILAGDDQTGITIMQMAAGLDTGDILYQVACPITPTTTTASLHDELAQLGGQALVTVLQDLPNYQQHAQVQDDSQANYADKISSTEGRINWQQDVADIDRQIRALNAYTEHNDTRVKVLACAPAPFADAPNDQPVGTVIAIDNQAIQVICGTSKPQILDLTQLQWAGGKPLSAAQINAGNKLQIGERLA